MSERRSPRTRAVAVAASILSITLGLALRDIVGVWLATGLGAVAALAAILAVDRGRMSSWLAVTWGGAAVGLATGVAMALATHLLYPPLAATFGWVEPEVRQLYGVIGAPPGPVAAFPVVALVILTEEIVWRGELMDLLSARLGTAATVVLASVAYVIPQIAIGSLLLALVAFGCGLVWSVLRRWSGTVSSPAIAHLVWDLAVFVLVPVL